jgi:hypothetical protein
MRAGVIALAVLLALVVAACGDDDSGGPAEPSPGGGLSREEYIQQADAVCEDGDRIGDATDRRLDRAGDNQQVADILSEGLEEQEEILDRYDAIEPPPSERDFHEAFVESVRDQLALVRRVQDAFEEEDTLRVSDLRDEIDDISARREGLVEGHGGFEQCGDK